MTCYSLMTQGVITGKTPGHPRQADKMQVFSIIAITAKNRYDNKQRKMWISIVFYVERGEL